MKKPIRCTINHSKGTYYAFTVKDALAMVLLMINIQYSPFGVAKWNICKACRLIEEFCELVIVERRLGGSEKAELTRLTRRLGRSREYILKARTRKALCTRYYDVLLSLEGMGLLHGFGFSNMWGDKIKGNSEKQSLTVGG